jgi:hypothetical protein
MVDAHFTHVKQRDCSGSVTRLSLTSSGVCRGGSARQDAFAIQTVV